MNIDNLVEFNRINKTLEKLQRQIDTIRKNIEMIKGRIARLEILNEIKPIDD